MEAWLLVRGVGGRDGPRPLVPGDAVAEEQLVAHGACASGNCSSIYEKWLRSALPPAKSLISA